MLWEQRSVVCVQGPPGPAGLQGPIGAPGPAVSISVVWHHVNVKARLMQTNKPMSK